MKQEKVSRRPSLRSMDRRRFFFFEGWWISIGFPINFGVGFPDFKSNDIVVLGQKFKYRAEFLGRVYVMLAICALAGCNDIHIIWLNHIIFSICVNRSLSNDITTLLSFISDNH